jgi:hypothetical protein
MGAIALLPLLENGVVEERNNAPKLSRKLRMVGFGKLSAKQAETRAFDLAGKALELASNLADTRPSLALSETLEELPIRATQVSDAKAMALATRLLPLIARVTVSYQLKSLTETFAAFAPKLPPQEAARQASLLTHRAVDLLASTRDDEELAQLSQVVTSLTVRVPEKEKAGLTQQVTKGVGEETDRWQLRARAEMLAVLGWNLARTDLEQRASVLLERAGVLSLEPGEADPMRPLGQALAALAPVANREAYTEVVRRVVPGLARNHRTLTDGDNEKSLITLAAYVAPQEQIDLLKYPTCVGELRRALIRQVAKRYGYTGTDLWGLVAYLEQNHPELDLASPIRKPWITSASRGR